VPRLDLGSTLVLAKRVTLVMVRLVPRLTPVLPIHAIPRQHARRQVQADTVVNAVSDIRGMARMKDLNALKSMRVSRIPAIRMPFVPRRVQANILVVADRALKEMVIVVTRSIYAPLQTRAMLMVYAPRRVLVLLTVNV